MKKVMYIVGLLSAMAFVTGWFFGLMRFSGAFELQVYGSAVFFFIYVPMMTVDYFKTNTTRVLSERLKVILGLACALLLGVAGVFKLMHLAGTRTILIMGAVTCIFGFLPFFFFSLYKKSIS